MIIAINYSDENFKKHQQYNTKTAYKYGKVDKVIEYSPNDIDVTFKSENKDLLSIKRGGGLWIWKPYFILKTLELMKEGDYLIYSDSGSSYCSDVHHFVHLLTSEKKDILAFMLPLLEIQWTKKETFDYFNEHDYSRNQFLATYLFLRKSSFTVNFIKEWLECMKNPICSSPVDNSVHTFKNFISHREDQSVLSLLCYKYGIDAHRDPSEYGDYPWLYKYMGFAWRYIKYDNSPYPRIFINERKQNPKYYRFKIFVKDILNKIGLFRFWFDRYYKY